MNSRPDLPQPFSGATKESRISPLPGIGEVPEIAQPEISQKLVGFESKDARSRTFNLLRSQLIKKLAASSGRLIGVTSPAPNAGKSFVASNLAASMSQLSSKQTVLIDLDLRRSTVAEIFGLEGPEGLTDYLLGEEVPLSSIGRRIGTSNLIVYPTFPTPVNSAELMVSDRLLELIRRARALSDDAIVIFDLPPVFANDDAMLVAEHLDGILLVVEQGVTTKKQLESSMQLLHPTPMLGTVFNRFTGGIADPYGYGGKYDNYYSD
ncbi:CpsD/CapB family tyrosine-protein kinase [Allopontixanthobacter sediminis]|uniref:Chromosome partitioning protein n=1 Tax=Allopontixanthobacter sediminis TaxID=1689985 RepID=A0A845AYQ8_9SPHN|nr:CpsD/CapB family tyrosine-protein kinase [Allopontixanthobacter sediminis]MXP44633.1 chromosome partitioning protein [Allopontixanthobacter sediminis]